jgi:hypothetical protein
LFIDELEVCDVDGWKDLTRVEASVKLFFLSEEPIHLKQTVVAGGLFCLFVLVLESL